MNSIETARATISEGAAAATREDRSLGARNRATVAVEVLLEGEAENLTRKTVTFALRGNVALPRTHRATAP
jgi:hypothetical protein